MLEWAKLLLSLHRGHSWVHRAHRAAIRAAPNAYKGIDAIGKACPNDDYDEAPIFVFSAGWRSGSTLLQRLLMSGGEAVIWGEPYDRSQLVQQLARTLAPHAGDWPPQNFFMPEGKGIDELSGEWIAAMYPPLSALREGHRALFHAMFASPAKARGAKRWGIKEVRWGLNEAAYLKWLFPQAKFIFLHRHPFRAYVSYNSMGRHWYDEWPDRPVFTPTAFGRHWKKLVSEFREAVSLTNGIVLSYEDLVAGKVDAEALQRYLQLRVDFGTLSTKVRGGNRDRKVSRLESILLHMALGRTPAANGYRSGPFGNHDRMTP